MVTSVKKPASVKRTPTPAATPVASKATKASKPAANSAKTETSKKAVKTPAKLAPSRAAAAPSLRFLHSQALRERTDAVLDALEASPSHPGHGEAMADLTTALIEAGMDDYFLRGLKEAKVGFVTEQSARMGILGAVRLISSISRKYLERMTGEQLQGVGRHIRSLRG
jgi:hypothetical protein